MLDSNFFTFFKPKNELFGEFLDPTYFLAAGPKFFLTPNFFGYLLKKKKCKNFATPKKFRAFGPKILGVQKLPKKLVFWLKKCENFQIRQPIFSLQYFFIPPMRSKMHFALKSAFAMETVCKKID